MQRQTAVTADLKSKQLLLFVFANKQYITVQRQIAVTAQFKRMLLLLFVMTRCGVHVST